MIIVYWADANLLLQKEKQEELLATLPLHLQQRINAYALPEDRTVRIAGKLLLKIMLEDHGTNAGEVLDGLQYADNGKPFTTNSNYSFNISHSGDKVFVVFSDSGNIGIDAELIKPVSLVHYENFFTRDEWKIIKSAANPEHKFFDLWTRKEAVLKASGFGVHHPMQTIDTLADVIILNGIQWQIISLDVVDGYVIHIATDAMDTSYSCSYKILG